MLAINLARNWKKEWFYQDLSIEEVYEAYIAYKDKFIPLYAPDPSDINSISKFEKWKNKGIKGCGELKVTLNWNSDSIISFLTSFEKYSLPLIFHMEEKEYRYKNYDDLNLINKIIYRMYLSNKIFGFPKCLMVIV